MTRKECEERILEKLEEIRNIKNQYCGDNHNVVEWNVKRGTTV